MKRILTAAALIPIVVYVVLWANFWVFFAVLTLVAFLCYREFDVLGEAYGFGPPGPVGYGAGLLLLVSRQETWLLILGLALILMAAAMRGEDLAKALPRAAVLLAGVLYIFGAWKCAMPLRELDPHWLMYGLLVNWSGDMGAYYVGRRWGRHKLAPRISPNKSWEGAVASVVSSLLIAGPYLLYFVPWVGLAQAAALTVAANAAGQLGDLTESAIKRGAGIKDSGTILPGHGGFLDRVDSTLFSLPLIYAYLKLAG
jgi:phosphatidate cytidylyltransferase